MNTKDITKNFKKNGFVVLRNFLSKPQLKKIFFQLNQLIDVPLESINTPSKKKLTLDEKYLLLKKENPKLKSHFYETITYLDSINSISNSTKITNIVKDIMKETTVFVVSSQIKVNAGDAVIFHNYLFHGTLPNLNKKKCRWVYLVRFNSINKTPFIKNSNSPLAILYTADYSLL